MASTASSRRRRPSFRIHEDVAPAGDTGMDKFGTTDAHDDECLDDAAGHEVVDEQPSDDDQTDSSDDDLIVDDNVQWDIQQLQASLPDFQQRFRLIKRIGEGSLAPS